MNEFRAITCIADEVSEESLSTILYIELCAWLLLLYKCQIFRYHLTVNFDKAYSHFGILLCCESAQLLSEKECTFLKLQYELMRFHNLFFAAITRISLAK